MPDFTLGELTLMEIALCQFLKDVDINMSAGQQVQQTITKIEIQISKLSAATKDQNSEDLNPPPDLVPTS